IKKAAAITNNAAEKQNQNLEDLLISSRTFIVHLHRPGLAPVGFLLGQERACRSFLRLRDAELIRKWLGEGTKNVACSGTFRSMWCPVKVGSWSQSWILVSKLDLGLT